MENYLSSLGQKRGREFWTSYKALLNTKHEEVGLLRSKERRLLYAPEGISKEFESTFFGGEHLKEQIFNNAILENCSWKNNDVKREYGQKIVEKLFSVALKISQKRPQVKGEIVVLAVTFLISSDSSQGIPKASKIQSVEILQAFHRVEKLMNASDCLKIEKRNYNVGICVLHSGEQFTET